MGLKSKTAQNILASLPALSSYTLPFDSSDLSIALNDIAKANDVAGKVFVDFSFFKQNVVGTTLNLYVLYKRITSKSE